MKTYAIYITDKEGYGGECKIKAENKSEAMKQARQGLSRQGRRFSRRFPRACR